MSIRRPSDARRLLRRGADAYASVITVGACIALAVATLHIFVDALTTKILLYPIQGTHQFVTYYYMVALFFLPLGYAESQDAHISADLVHGLLPRRLRRAVTAANYVLLTGFVGLLAWHATLKALQQTRIADYQVVAGWHLVLWPSRWLAVLGLVAMLAVAALKALDAILTGLPEDGDPAAHEEGLA